MPDRKILDEEYPILVSRNSRTIVSLKSVTDHLEKKDVPHAVFEITEDQPYKDTFHTVVFFLVCRKRYESDGSYDFKRSCHCIQHVYKRVRLVRKWPQNKG